MRFLRPLILTLIIATATLVPAFSQPAMAVPYQGSQPGLTGSQPDANPKNDPITDKAAKDSSVLDYVNSAYQFMAVVGGMLAVLMLVYAGYRYMTSYGDPENIKDAKDIIEKALIGLTLLILAALILNTINPRTAQDPCNPGEAGCGTIDFSKPQGK